MSSVDDPMLALIMRFVGCNGEVRVSEAEFLHLQAEAIRTYAGAFPKCERNERAVEWIAAHAEDYRERLSQCIENIAAESSRCPDCPLVGGHGERTCEIHDRWLAILDAYVHHRITSKNYVKTSLALLRKHKALLKPQTGEAQPVPQSSPRPSGTLSRGAGPTRI